MKRPRNIAARPHPGGQGAHQITFEWGSGRRVIDTGPVAERAEDPPHGAGSYHDPDQHAVLMDRVERMLLGE